MIRIPTTDNSTRTLTDSELAAKSDIELISDKKISDLLSGQKNLLVFPLDLKQHGDEIGDDQILSFCGRRLRRAFSRSTAALSTTTPTFAGPLM